MTRYYGNELGKQQQVMRMDFGGFDYAQILFKECNLLRICDFWV